MAHARERDRATTRQVQRYPPGVRRYPRRRVQRYRILMQTWLAQTAPKRPTRTQTGEYPSTPPYPTPRIPRYPPPDRTLPRHRTPNPPLPPPAPDTRPTQAPPPTTPLAEHTPPPTRPGQQTPRSAHQYQPDTQPTHARTRHSRGGGPPPPATPDPAPNTPDPAPNTPTTAHQTPPNPPVTGYRDEAEPGFCGSASGYPGTPAEGWEVTRPAALSGPAAPLPRETPGQRQSHG